MEKSLINSFEKRPNWTIRSVNGKKMNILPQSVVHEMAIIERDSYEDINGNLHRNILGVKDKFTLAFPAMYESDFEMLLSIVTTGELVVEYEEFDKTDQVLEGLFYRGTISKVPYQLLGNGQYLYNAGITIELNSYNVRRLKIDNG
ncbi:hypothetical protein G7062_06485 [Erysipelothrix sp. HDW6C]|uniref:DUF6711 family protein n=1 Tax=Erysipelothrix sp. HDW6C TaxID=2714930 RepID=UPI00140E3F87|nr:DUF6711 family protein [Erysipelothrix sp. HDW6C]QIK69955.1 hypothetical protein G7062_06485 [Erysipelothrix sp. HDW6C]